MEDRLNLYHTFAQVGVALTQWEGNEMQIAMLFDKLFISPHVDLTQVFGAIESHRARTDMLSAALGQSRARLPTELFVDLGNIVSRYSELNSKRNQIAHGAVQFFSDPETQELYAAIMPHWQNSRRFDLGKGPKYRLSSKNIADIHSEFVDLSIKLQAANNQLDTLRDTQTPQSSQQLLE